MNLWQILYLHRDNRLANVFKPALLGHPSRLFVDGKAVMGDTAEGQTIMSERQDQTGPQALTAVGRLDVEPADVVVVFVRALGTEKANGFAILAEQIAAGVPIFVAYPYRTIA